MYLLEASILTLLGAAARLAAAGSRLGVDVADNGGGICVHPVDRDATIVGVTADPTELVLRPLRLDDEAAFRRAHAEMATEGFTFGLWFDHDTSFPDYVRLIERRSRGLDLEGRLVPSTFLVADVGGVIVGRASIRYELNDFLLQEGGHIGYGVLREHRRRGYATEILRRSMEITDDLGIARVLVTCDDDNVGSATVIERCGGVFDSYTTGESGVRMRRYWIDRSVSRRAARGPPSTWPGAPSCRPCRPV